MFSSCRERYLDGLAFRIGQEADVGFHGQLELSERHGTPLTLDGQAFEPDFFVCYVRHPSVTVRVDMLNCSLLNAA